MYESVLQNALRLPRQLKEELVAALKAAIFEEMAARPAGDPSRCPRCGHAHVVSKGRDRDGGRRWLCRGCGRTFSAKTSGVLALSRLGPDAWSEYVEGMVEGLPLRKLAERCGVCLKTSWYMRMRVCSVMESRLAPFRCDRGTSVQIDEKYPNESLSGHRGRARVKMPRAPHENGHGVRLRGISGEKACVLTGVNDLGDCFCPDAIGLAQIIPLALPVEVELPVGVPGEEGTCSLALGALDGDEVEVRLDAVHERVEVPEVGVAGLVFLAHEIH
jgi:transposase-like protein